MALERDGFRWILCNSVRYFHVHHRKYSRPGEERLRDLVTLCEGCHARHHDRLSPSLEARVEEDRRAEARDSLLTLLRIKRVRDRCGAFSEWVLHDSRKQWPQLPNLSGTGLALSSSIGGAFSVESTCLSGHNWRCTANHMRSRAKPWRANLATHLVVSSGKSATSSEN
jgi:hypothetical protein